LRILRLVAVAAALCAGPAQALDRSAFTFAEYDLRARVTPAQQAIEVRGRVVLRNDSAAAQKFAVLQISSTLAWQSITAAGKPLVFSTGPYATDIDHTGSVSEAIVRLPGEIAPHRTVELRIAYAGTIPADTTRWTRIGIAASVAGRTDWDQIGPAFTAVRGVGYVCWYPVAMESASLSESQEMFAELGDWKARHAASTMRLTLRADSAGSFLTNGRETKGQRDKETEGPADKETSPSSPGPVVSEPALSEANVSPSPFVSLAFLFSPMGMFPPTIVLGEYSAQNRQAITVMYLPGHEAAAQEYALAAEKLQPLLSDWLGAAKERATVVDLPEGYSPFDSGSVLFAPLAPLDRPAAETSVAHLLAHSSIQSPRLWIAEGLAHFAQALVREQQGGRRAALDYMQQYRPALAEAEGGRETERQRDKATERQSDKGSAKLGDTETRGLAPGEPLIRTTDEIYFRWKAMFVWWMLRDIIGDDALQRVLRAYRAADDKEPSYLQRLAEKESRRSLEWFFDDWVYRDRGLPDLCIESVALRALLPDNYLVTVTVQNDGDARAEAPVIIPLKRGQSVQRLLVPAHGKATTRLTVPEAPQKAVVNDGSIPETDMSNNTFIVATEP
jgi:hypothetical protein